MSKFTTGLTDAQRERLSILTEEIGEALQIVGKVERHGYESKHPTGKHEGRTNKELLEYELGHVFYAIDMLIDSSDLNHRDIVHHCTEKQNRENNYIHFQ